MSLFSSYRGAEAESFERASKLAVSFVFWMSAVPSPTVFSEGVTETQTEPTEDVHGERRLRWASHICISSS